MISQSQQIPDNELNKFDCHFQNDQNNSKRHRRSKHEQEGRNYNCQHCGKSYLSKPALNNHMNTKHSDILAELNIQKRCRGRPRKYLVDTGDNYNEKTKFENFFSIPKRSNAPFYDPSNINWSGNNINHLNNLENIEGNPGISSEEQNLLNNLQVSNSIDNNQKPMEAHIVINIKNVVDTAFKDLYLAYPDAFISKIETPGEHPILNYLLEPKELPLELTKCDDIICKYIEFVKPIVNEIYFIFITKFLCLFRDSINKTEKSKNPLKYETVEYSAVENAESFPEQCNEFFSNYLESQNFFGFNEEEKNELIDIIQHFCYWLFINNFTKSKLSLAG